MYPVIVSWGGGGVALMYIYIVSWFFLCVCIYTHEQRIVIDDNCIELYIFNYGMFFNKSWYMLVGKVLLNVTKWAIAD